MSELATIRRLKVEENKILEILEMLKNQLSALKVEELDLKSRIRDTNIAMRTEELAQATVSHHMTGADGRDVNGTQLDLTVDAAKILSMLAAGGRETEGEDEDEESEMEDDEDVEDPLVSFLDY